MIVFLWFTVANAILSDNNLHIANPDFNLVDEVISGQLIDIESEFDALLLKSGDSLCVKEAVRDIIHECVVSGVDFIDPMLRKALAVKLSICEFQNSQVQIPMPCESIVTDQDVNDCVQSFQGKEQYWTTYSGNYRETFHICYSESLPFAKDQIVGLYHNVSKIYNRIFINLQNVYRESDKTREEVKSKFGDLLEIIRIIIQQQQEQSDEMKDTYESYKEDYQEAATESLEIFQDLVKDSETKFKEMKSNINFFNGEVANLLAKLEDGEFQKKLEDLKRDIQHSYKKVGLESSQLFNTIITDLEKTSHVSAKNKDTMNDMTNTLQMSNDLTNFLMSSLVDANDLVKDQNIVIKSEFESNLLEFSDITLQFITNTVEKIDDNLVILENSINYMYDKIDTVLIKVELLDTNVSNLTNALNSIDLNRFSHIQNIFNPFGAFSFIFNELGSIIRLLVYKVTSTITTFSMSLFALVIVYRFWLGTFGNSILSASQKALNVYIKLTVSISIGIILAMLMVSMHLNTYY